MQGPIDVADLRRQHTKLLSKIGRGMDAAAAEIATRSKNMAQNTSALTYRGRNGGRDAWQAASHKVQNGAAGWLINKKFHMWCQEFGTGLYGPKHAKYRIPSIGNTSAKILRFEQNGKIRFARWVMHPGVKPKGIGRASIFGRQAPFFGEDHSANLNIINRHLGHVGDTAGMKLAAQ